MDGDWAVGREECARKAGDILGLGAVSRACRDAEGGDIGAIAFVRDAAGVRDIIRDVAALTPAGEALSPDREAQVRVPHDLILRARNCLFNWGHDGLGES